MKTRLIAAILATSVLAACSTAEPDAQATAASASTPAATLANPDISAQEDFRQSVGDRVHFPTDSAALSPEALDSLSQQAAWLRRNGGGSVVIEGHADERGTREYNLALGERRATAVRDYLTAQGVPADRLRVVSFGKERPVCPEATPVCWAENRRAVTVIR